MEGWLAAQDVERVAGISGIDLWKFESRSNGLRRCVEYFVPLPVKEVDPELEQLLREEEAIEARCAAEKAVAEARKTGSLTVTLVDGSVHTFELTGERDVDFGSRVLKMLDEWEWLCFDGENGVLVVKAVDVRQIRAVRV